MQKDMKLKEKLKTVFANKNKKEIASILEKGSARAILLIGRTGRGKSTLANVFLNKNNNYQEVFKESAGSTSETRKIQHETFKEGDDSYLIIDTPGIGDTKLSTNQVLDIIAEAVYLIRNGVSQVLFVINGRFDQFEVATYNLLRTIIFDQCVTNYTTIVRTRFDKFKSKKACKDDISSMSADISELDEIISSCQGRIIHVNNPSLNIVATDREDEEEREIREKTIAFAKSNRSESRKKIFGHIVTHQGVYQPTKLKELSSEIADDYFDYLRRKKELEEELKKLEVQKNNISSSDYDNKDKLENAFKIVTGGESIFERIKERKDSNQEKDNSGGVGKKIVQLEDKRVKLKREIEEKEQIIRKKILKHIFNNYSEINKISGGEIFLSSIVEDNNNWEVINQKFADKKLVLEWKSNGFDYEQVQKWATALRDIFNPKVDTGFCVWLRDDKRLAVEKIKRLSNLFNIKQLRQEYAQWLEKETSLLELHNKSLSFEKENWKIIHHDFSKENILGKTYQQWWEEEGFTEKEAEEWITIGWLPSDCWKVHLWKDKGFTPLQAQEWIKAGLKIEEAELANYLRFSGYLPAMVSMRKLKGEKFNAQEWVDINFPLDKRNEIKRLNIDQKNLTGSLSIIGWPNLKAINCWRNHITNLIIIDCPQLQELCANHNLLTNLVIDCPQQLIYLNISNNNFQSNVSFLKDLINLERLVLSNNCFHDSLEYLRGYKKIKELDVRNTKISGGLEYLPKGLNEIWCRGCSELEEKLVDYSLEKKSGKYDLSAWRKDHQELIFRIEEEKLEFYIEKDIKWYWQT